MGASKTIIHNGSIQLEPLDTALRLGYRLGPVTQAGPPGGVRVGGMEGSLGQSDESSIPTIELPDKWTSGALSDAATIVDYTIAALHLERVQLPTVRPLVCFISRRNKRVILNEAKLLDALAQMNVDTKVLVLEDMPLYEQVRTFRQCTVLTGIHGSGLTNAMYMRRDTVCC